MFFQPDHKCQPRIGRWQSHSFIINFSSMWKWWSTRDKCHHGHNHHSTTHHNQGHLVDHDHDGGEEEAHLSQEAALVGGGSRGPVGGTCIPRNMWGAVIIIANIAFFVILVIIIIITRPKPTYGQQGLAGSWARIQSGGYILGRCQRLTSRLRRSARIG